MIQLVAFIAARSILWSLERAKCTTPGSAQNLQQTFPMPDMENSETITLWGGAQWLHSKYQVTSSIFSGLMSLQHAPLPSSNFLRCCSCNRFSISAFSEYCVARRLNPPQKITCGYQASMSFCDSSVRCQEKRLPQRPDLRPAR